MAENESRAMNMEETEVAPPPKPAEAYEPIQVLLGRVLAELPAIGKDDYNKQQQFHFRSHDAVLNALNPLMAKYCIVPVPEVLERISTIRQTRGGGAMYEVNLHVAYTLYGPRGDCIRASAWGEGTDMGDKSTNKAMTMAFKNVLAQVFAVSTADTVDSDSQTPQDTLHPSAVPAAPPAPVRTASDAAAALSSWVGDPEPWIREAAAVVAANREITLEDEWKWKDLPEAARVTITETLWKALDSLKQLDGFDSYADAEATQTAVRTAFTNAFGAPINGPDPFDAPIKF